MSYVATDDYTIPTHYDGCVKFSLAYVEQVSIIPHQQNIQYQITFCLHESKKTKDDNHRKQQKRTQVKMKFLRSYLIRTENNVIKHSIISGQEYASKKGLFDTKKP